MNYASSLEQLSAGGVLVTASRRLSRVLHQAYRQKRLQQGQTVWQTPVILPFEAWLTRLHSELLAARLIDYRLLDSEQEKQLWQEVLQCDASQVFLSPIRTASSLANAWRTLHGYNAEHAPDFNLCSNDVSFFSSLSQRYETALSNLNAVDMALLPGRLAEVLPSALRMIDTERSNNSSEGRETQVSSVTALCSDVTLVGFLHTSPRLLDFLQCIDQIYPVAVHDLLSGQSIDLAQCRQQSQTRQALAQPLQQSSSGLFSHASTTADAELLSVARWSRDLLENPSSLLEITGMSKSDVAGDTDMPSVVIVVFDLQNRWQQVQRIFDEVFFPALSPHEIQMQVRPYDFGVGSGLTDRPIVRAALLALKLVLARNRENSLSGAEFSELLLSPHCMNLPPHADETSIAAEYDRRLQFDRKVRNAGRHEIRTTDLLAFDSLPATLRRALERVKEPKYPKGVAAFWCQYFSKILEAFGWPGAALQSSEYQVFQAWTDTLQSYARTSSVAPTHNAQAALATLRRLLADRRFQPETSELPIQILSPEESIGLRSDIIWVTGMDSNNWPGMGSANPWLPGVWQKQVSVPGSSAEQVARDAELNWQAWQTSASTVIASFARERDGQEQVAATVLDGLTELPLLGDSPSGSLQRCSQLLQEELKPTLEILSDANGPPIADGAAVRGGAGIFEHQSQCPFKAFARHRLLSQLLEDTAPGIDSRIKGNLLHTTMEILWQKTGNLETLVALDDKALSELVTCCISDAIERESQKNRLGESPQLLTLEQSRLHTLIIKWLQVHEMKRLDFEVTATEKSLEVVIQDMRFELKVDRIDRLNSGEEIVIDYKTGKNNSPGGWTHERMSNPQLPLYAVAQGDIKGLAFAQIARDESAFKGLAESKDLIKGLAEKVNKSSKTAEAASDAQDWLALVEFWREQTNILANEIKTGVAIVDPQPNACTFCDYASLCRIDPLRLDALEDDDSNEGTPFAGLS